MTREELVDQALHRAEEPGTLDSFDPSAIKGPKRVVRLEGKGAEIDRE